MDNMVTLYHGGSVTSDDYGNVRFVEMQRVPLIFSDRPSFSELVARAREELHCYANEESITVEGLLHFGSKDTILRRLILIGCEDQWDKYVKLVMKNEIQCLDLVVRKMSIDPTPHGYSPELGDHAPFDPPLPDLAVDVEEVRELPDALSAPNEGQISQPVRVECRTDDVVAAPQDHPRYIPDNVGAPPVAPSGNVEEVCRDSNSVDVQIVNDLEPYEIASVKIVDSGEVSDTNTQNQLRGEKEKKLRRAEDNSDAEGKVKTKKPSSDDNRRKKRKHYSSDSYSSDTSDSRSYPSDSGLESESYSSSSLDTSSSSDHRHKRRKGSKKEKHKPAKRKSSHKKSKSKSRGTKRKSKRSYGSSSDDSKSSKTNSSSDSENAGRHTKHSLKKGLLADQENTKMVNLEKSRTLELADKGKQTITTGNISHEGGKPTNKDENGADDRSENQNSEDRSIKLRDDPGASSRSSPIRADANLTKADGNRGADAAEAGISRAGTERNPLSNEPVPTNGKDLAMDSTDNGQRQRIRKGRGFTQQYAFARRYRTPSPERSPVRSRYNGGRNDRWNHFNRYGRNGPYSARLPVRRYRGSPRASSPSRYPRRDRSRSRSRSPVRRRDRGGYRQPSPRRSRSRSPTEQQRRDRSNRPRSGRGGGGPDHRGSSPPANSGRSRTRLKSRDPSRSRSPDAAPVRRGSSKYNRRRSSSSRSSSPAGSKGLVSY